MLKKSVISITDSPGWDYSGEGEREIHQIQGNVQARAGPRETEGSPGETIHCESGSWRVELC